MLFMNEWDVRFAVERFDRADTPNLGRGAAVLFQLMEWTNRNTRKPCPPRCTTCPPCPERKHHDRQAAHTPEL